MTPATCPAFYPNGHGGALHRTEPELNAFVKRYLGREMTYLKWRSEAFAAKGEIYKMLVNGEINPASGASKSFRGNLGLALTSEVKPGQWVYPITIIFNGGCSDYKPKSLIEIPMNTGSGHEHFQRLVRGAVGTRRYLTAKRSQQKAIADFLDKFLSND